MGFRTSTLALLAFASTPGSVEGAQCAKAWENCSESMCCSTPYYECVRKHEATRKDGIFIAAYAQCRFANATAGQSSCPCKNPPCFDYAHDYNVKGPKMPWNCIVLTGGCSEAFKPCGPGRNLDDSQKKTWNAGPPCCQWGCTCNYSMDWNAQCMPPKGLYACTKDAQKVAQKKNDRHKSASPVSEDTGAANDEDDWSDDDAARLYANDEEAPHLRGPGSFPWLAVGGSVALLVTGVAVVIRKRRIERGSYNESPTFVEADDESS